MGLDVSVVLIVGVPLAVIGPEEEETEQARTTDRLGKPTGKMVTIRRAYFCAPNGQRFLVGSNEQGVLEDDNEIGYELALGLEDEWVHVSDGENLAPDTAIIGLQVEPEIKLDNDDRHEGFRGAQTGQIVTTTERVKTELFQRFGYTGPVYVVALAGYSY